MIKQLTLFCTFAIFMLAVGGVVTPLQAHCVTDDPNAVHSGDHPHCPGGSTDDQLYDVEITGFISGVGNNWGAGKKQVGFNFSNSAGPNGQLSNLDFFRGLFGAEGIICFPDETIEISSVILEKHKRGTAKALIWFLAYTHDPTNKTQYLYHLELNGLFTGPNGSKDWPPASSNTLEMTEWSTHLGNEGNTIKNVSCLSSGDTEDDTDFAPINITVTPDGG